MDPWLPGGVKFNLEDMFSLPNEAVGSSNKTWQMPLGLLLMSEMSLEQVLKSLLSENLFVHKKTKVRSWTI